VELIDDDNETPGLSRDFCFVPFISGPSLSAVPRRPVGKPPYRDKISRREADQASEEIIYWHNALYSFGPRLGLFSVGVPQVQTCREMGKSGGS
jgi:hypothetical protein